LRSFPYSLLTPNFFPSPLPIIQPQANNGFAAFGWYRVILGGTILALLMARVPLEIME
jgi:hypothetical protein